MANVSKFEREKICYEQDCEHMRSLNQIMWQVPMIAMTLTGGLWYAVATVKSVDIIARTGLLLFSAIANVGLIVVINRVRDVIEVYLNKMRGFNPEGFANASNSKDRVVCKTFSGLMGVGATFSLVAVYLILCGHWRPAP